MLKFKKAYILGICLIIAVMVVYPGARAYPSQSLRIPVETPDRIEKEQARLYLEKIVSLIGNQRSPLTFGLNISSKEVDINSLLDTIENSDVFKYTYKKNWQHYVKDIENNPHSPAYIQIIDYLSPYHQTAVYRSMEQHTYLSKKIPDLISKKMALREGDEPIIIRIATLGGGLEPISLGTTIIETIRINYPELEIGKDIILEISDIQIDPRVIKDTVERISSDSEEEFTLKDTNWGDPERVSEEEKGHIRSINRNIKK